MNKQIPKAGFSYSWHPGRFRRSIPVMGLPHSKEREAMLPLVIEQINQNAEIGKAEGYRLQADYMDLPERLTA